MADIARIKRNIKKMVDQGAPEADIDAYISTEGISLEDLHAPAEMPTEPYAGPLGVTDETALGRGLNTFEAATAGSHAGLMGGYDDEIGAGLTAPVTATMDWFKGGDFDVKAAYQKNVDLLRKQKGERREHHPIASIAGEVAGGLGLGAGAGKVGLTLAGRAPSTLAAIGEGAGYGALYGSGEADGTLEERARGAGTGALIGGATGGLLERGGAGLAAVTRKAPVLPASEELKVAKDLLYKTSEKEGFSLKEGAINRLKANMKAAGGDINPDNRKLTAGTIRDVDRRLKPNMSLKELDEFRQSIGTNVGAAAGDDQVKLMQMKDSIDSFLDTVSPQDYTGGVKGVEIIKSARQMTAKMKKMEVIEEIRDRASRPPPSQTPEEALLQEMRSLANNPKKMRQFSKEEQKLIKKVSTYRSMAAALRGVGKFKPGIASPMAVLEMFTSGIPVTTISGLAVAAGARKVGGGMTKKAVESVERQILGLGAVPKGPNRLAPLAPGVTAASTAKFLSPQTERRR
jgi:hypothetical protein